MNLYGSPLRPVNPEKPPPPAAKDYRRREEEEDGCRFHDHCLTCPFPMCYMDEGASSSLIKSLKQQLERMALIAAEDLDDQEAADRFQLSLSSWLRSKKTFFQYYPERQAAETARLAELAARRPPAPYPGAPGNGNGAAGPGQYIDPANPDGRLPYDPKNLEPERCSAPVTLSSALPPFQCRRYRGYGPNKAYCKFHAAKAPAHLS